MVSHHTDDGLSINTACMILSDPIRRHLLYFLDEHDTAMRSELADVLTGWLSARLDDGAATPVERERMAVQLHHAHLPLLAEEGIVALDGEEVSLRGANPVLADLYTTTRNHEDAGALSSIELPG